MRIVPTELGGKVFDSPTRSTTIEATGFNRRKMEDERRREVEKQAGAKRTLDPQVRADLAPLSPGSIGSCGCAAQGAEPPTRSICGRSIAIPTPPSLILSPSHAARAGRNAPFRRASYGYLRLSIAEQKCGSSTHAGCSAR